MTYPDPRLSIQFQIKDQTKFEIEPTQKIIEKSPENGSAEEYKGETHSRVSERIIDHNKDKNSHLPQHTHNEKQTHVWVKDFSVLNNNDVSKIKKKTRESIYLRSEKSILNAKETSLKVHFFN